MKDSRELIKKGIDDLLEESKSIFKPEKDLFEEKVDYQIWYTKSIKVVETLLPDRLEEFNRLYKVDKILPSGSIERYTIRDYLLDKYSGMDSNFSIMAPKFEQQVAILRSAQTRIDYILADIKGVLQADLFDNEIDASESLFKSKHYRAAGTLAGVVLESHLKDTCSNHSLKVKKNAVLSEYNDELKNNGIIDTPKWRKIQALSDIRNLCSHKKERDPTPEEVTELIEGVKNVIKTVF